MKLQIAILALCALSVHAFPKHGLPKTLKSLKPEHVLSYVNQLASEQLLMSRAVNEKAATNNMVCFQESNAALLEVSNKAETAIIKCERILTEAQVQADNELESNRKSLDEDNKNIQSDLSSCDSSNLEDATDALKCYEAQGQQNISPVSGLSSKARTFKRTYDITISLAKTKSDGCSHDVATESEQISSQIFNNLNKCMANGGVWEPIEIPEFGPTDPVTEPPTTIPPEIVTPEPETTVQPEPEPETTAQPEPETTLEPEIEETTFEPENETTEAEPETTVQPEVETPEPEPETTLQPESDN